MIDASARPAVASDSMNDVLGRLSQLRVLPVATVSAERAQRVGRVLVTAGLPCIEIAFRTDDAATAIERASKVDGLLVGAGTVRTREQAKAAAAAGAAFAVAPALNEEVVECCRELDLPFFPGVATPTEIDRAHQLGLRTLKIFPVAAVGGMGFLRAVSATYPEFRFIPTGGVDKANLRDYLALPSVLCCGGSWIIGNGTIGEVDYAELARRARAACTPASS
ncbi:MAG TPA: bifunctional 4-hydroxy-2-oxoglutarate aldolase/2-dehydro-3-deoxy-phosphogluconate aldolase [Solirubrobacteraceae bacterium]